MTNTSTVYEDSLRLVLEKGEHKEDRTGTGTTSLFGHQMRFSLAEGFPLITTKKTFMRGIIHELLWFLQGNTNIQYLLDNNVHIWDAWAGPDGDLGPIYSASWRAIYAPSSEIVEIEIRDDKHKDFTYPFESKLLPSIECDLNTEKMWAVEDLGVEGKNRYYKVQLESGFIIDSISRPNWKSLLTKDLRFVDGYAKTVAGVGFKGKAFGKHDPRVYNMWFNMMSRCYNPQHQSYKFYGALGVTVSPVWHSFQYFAATLSTVPGFHEWKRSEDFTLDKDYFGSKIYSPTTCIFLSQRENSRLTKDGNALRIAGKDYLSYTDWALGNKKTAWYAKTRWDKGLAYKGIPSTEVEVIKPKLGHLFRRRVFIDQITDVIEQIKATPDSRRLIVASWNPPALPEQALPPCHAWFQFYVSNGKLSLQLYQRSADMFLGVPFNIASYALLVHMVAQQTGLEVGDFVWTGGDVHIYDNHKEQVALQLSREAYPFPTLKLAKRDSIFDYTFEDIEIVGYQSHPAIKAPVAV